MKKARYIIEAILAHSILFFFKILPADVASNIGGGLLGFIGPKLAVSRKAVRHAALAFPQKSAAEHQDIVRQMWDNLGRVMAEYPHLEKLGRDCVEIRGGEIMRAAIDDAGKGAIFVGAHLGNWELYGASVAMQFDQAPHLTYRAPNNPYVEDLLSRSRTLNGRIQAHPKSRETGRKLMQALKDHEYLGFLMDQKYNEGVSVPFFGHAAMTNPVAVQLAQKYECPLIPVRCERLDGARFVITFYPPLDLIDESGYALPVETVLGALHVLYESWITKRPGQWLWLHKRWKDI